MTAIYQNASIERDRFNRDLPLFQGERELISLESCVVDGNSMTANTLRCVPLVGLSAAASAVSTLAGGILGIPIGLSGLRLDCKKGGAALRYGDGEGVAHHALSGTTNFSYAALSGVSVAAGGMALGGVSAPTAMGSALGGLGFALYGALAICGVHGLVRSRAFGREFSQIKGDEEKLRWLKAQVSLSEEELKGKDPEKVLQKKWSIFERRTSPECARRVRNFSGKELIREVEKANFMTQVKYGLFILISIVGIAAFAALMIVLSPFSPALFAVGAVLWLTVDSSRLHKYIGEKLWNWHHET